MRLVRFAAFAACAACVGVSSTAFAQDDDEEEGWIEETVEEEEQAPAPPPPPKKKKAKKKKKKKVIIVEETAEEESPPAWTRGRRGRPKKTIVARPGEPPPPGYHLEHKSRKNLWIPGVVLLASGYAASALSSATLIAVDNGNCWDWDYDYYCNNRGDWGWGFVPLVGPFVIAADEDVDGGWRAGYALMGVAQNLGLALTIAGAASKRGVWVYDGGSRRGDAPLAPSVELVAGPGNLTLKGAF